MGFQQDRTLSIPKASRRDASGLAGAVGEMPTPMSLEVNFCFCNFLLFGALSAQLSFVPIAGRDVTSPRYKTHAHKKKMLEKSQ